MAIFSPTIGVLALQGAFAKHQAIFELLNVKTKMVRRPSELDGCDALVIPGGESTTMVKQLEFIGLRESLMEFAEKKPIFGTCAGLILMAKEVLGGSISPLGLLDISVERNGYGRQYESFSAQISNIEEPFRGVFIRAPRLQRLGEGVEVLAVYEGEPVLVRQKHFLASTFHPELVDNPAIHRYFLNMLGA